MFAEKPKDLSKPTPPAHKSIGQKFGIAHLTVEELVALLDEVRQRLPPTSLAQLSMEEELLLQYHSLRSVLNDVLADDEVPVNQRAQLANSVSTTLKQIADLQVSLYTSERFKDIENALIRALNTLPDEAAEAFLNDYASIIRKK